jgi:iron(III) transport system substrate-binding protein
MIPNPATSGTSFNLLTALITQIGEDKAFAYLDRLHPQVAQYTRSGAAPGKSVALGETSIAVAYGHDILRMRYENNAKIEISYPGEGCGYNVDAISLLKNAPQRELAVQFYDWMLSPSASQVMADYFIVPLLMEGVTLKKEAVAPSSLKLIHIDMNWAGESRERLVKAWSEKIKG